MCSHDGKQSHNSGDEHDEQRGFYGILRLSGGKKNTLYRREGSALRKAGAILPMLADTVHVAECMGDTPAIGLHVYGGDIFKLPRRMWNPVTLEGHALDWTQYEIFARVASSAPEAPAPEGR
jgi:predicted metal-dependent enzyme (double-stranded beta helix superfamily)